MEHGGGYGAEWGTGEGDEHRRLGRPTPGEVNGGGRAGGGRWMAVTRRHDLTHAAHEPRSPPTPSTAIFELRRGRLGLGVLFIFAVFELSSPVFCAGNLRCLSSAVSRTHSLVRFLFCFWCCAHF